MFLLSMNPQCLRVVIDFSSSLASSTFFRSGSDWYLRCMMDEMVTDVGWRVSQREVILAYVLYAIYFLNFELNCMSFNL